MCIYYTICINKHNPGIYMFYHQYIINRDQWQKIIKKFEGKKIKENSPVTVQDLVVYPKDIKVRFGESKNNTNPNSNLDLLPRLIDHIKSLSQIANYYHEHAYCKPNDKGESEIKKEHLNAITRLSLSEFSLYGKKPLTLEEFARLVGAIEVLAKQTHDNVHLLLSSFSIINEENKILNISLYVQCGQNPKIDTITKGAASKIDITYENSSNFSQQKELIDSIKVAKATPVSSYVGDDSGKTLIANNSILEIETKGGARFLQATDICLDHAVEHSKKLLLTQLDEGIDLTHFVPEQVDHIITSNSIHLRESAKLSSSVLHVDPNPMKFHDKENKYRPINETKVLNSNKIGSIISHHPKMKIKSSNGKTTVSNPPFGSDFHLVAYKERKLSGFKEAIASKVKVLNERILDKQINSILPLKDFVTMEKEAIKTYSAADSLLQQLSSKCKPTFFENLFETKNYYLKKAAKAIIDSSVNSLTSLGVEILEISSSWADDLKFQLESLNKNYPNSFTTKLQDLVDNFQNEFENQRGTVLAAGTQ